MKKRVIKLTESDLERMIEKVMREQEIENKGDYEMSGTRAKSLYTPSPREKEVQSVFGQYGEDIPPVVLRYMRKNPDKIVKRLYDIYGDKMFDYLPSKSMDEVMQKTVSQYEFSNPKDVKAFNERLKKVDPKKVSVTDKGAQISEEEKWIPKDLKKGRVTKMVGGKPTIEKINAKLKSLDSDKETPGIQAGTKQDLSKIKALNLAKTLKGLK